MNHSPGLWQPLTQEHRRELVDLAARAAAVAERTPSIKRVALRQIKDLAWRWTADAVDARTGIVVPDAVKYALTHLPHTTKAAAAAADARGRLGAVLRHEHAVPRSVLAERVLEIGSKDHSAIFALCTTYCVAALLSLAEDHKLNGLGLQRTMPAECSWGTSPTARYETAKIKLLQPSEVKATCSTRSA